LNYQSLTSQNNVIEDNIDEIGSYLNESSCQNPLLFESSRRLDDVVVKLNLLEERFGFDDERVLEQKELYSMLELRHLDIIRGLDEECNVGFVTVLFFYSNEGRFKDASERVSYILTTFKRMDSERIMIYSFDSNLDSPFVINLKNIHNITDVPIVVVNEEDVLRITHINNLTVYLEDPFFSLPGS